LDKFESIDPKTTVPLEKKYTSPKKFEFSFPLSKNEDDGMKNIVGVSWILQDGTDSYVTLLARVLAHLLLGNEGAILRKNLLESKLGKSIAKFSGLERELRELVFSVGLEGVKNSEIPEVEKVINTSLAQIMDQEIDDSEVRSALHQIEFKVKEITGDYYPFGLSTVLNFITPWLHGGDVVSFIRIDVDMKKLKDSLKDKNYLKEKIKEYFIDNPHKVSLVLRPDHSMKERADQELREKLEKQKIMLNSSQKDKLVQNARLLKERQEKFIDFSLLPKIEVKDLNMKMKSLKTSPEILEVAGSKLYFYDQSTNGISYIKYSFSQGDLNEEEVILLSLLATVFTKIGTKNSPYHEMAKRIGLYTGKVASSLGTGRYVNETDRAYLSFDIFAKCLDENIKPMMAIMTELINEYSLDDVDKIESIIKDQANELMICVADYGTDYAVKSAARNTSQYHRLMELTSGITFVRKINKISQMDRITFENVLEKMKALACKIFSKNNLNVAVVTSRDNNNDFQELVASSILSFPSRKNNGIDLAYEKTKRRDEACTTTTNVAYVVKTFSTPTLIHEDGAKFAVLAKMIGTDFLHSEIREKGGAYGGFSGYRAIRGIFYMASFRDPQITRTLKTFENALKWLNDSNFSQDDVDLAIIQVIAELDTPLSPSMEAFKYFENQLTNLSMNDWQKYRERILACSISDLRQVANKYLTGNYSVGMVTSKEMLDCDNPGNEFNISALIG